MEIKAKVKEIFKSIQGEGPFIGYQQLFIRFCNCNLGCKYCDTNFYSGDGEYQEFTPKELAKYINKFNIDQIHSISVTGGEPLLWADFLSEFIPLVKKPIYLETNATLSAAFEKIADKIDYVAADIKLPSLCGIDDIFNAHEKFFAVAKNTKFAKIVFDENITDDEIFAACDLAKKYDLTIILQPRMHGFKQTMTSNQMVEIFEKFITCYKQVRLIPQCHKFLEIE